MQAVISSVVQVVTVSDWPAIVTGIVTGAVGLAGILATYRQGKRAEEAASNNLLTRIDAENVQASIALKRQIYARYLVAFDAAADEAFIADASKDRAKAMGDSRAGFVQVTAVAYELGMIAPEAVGKAAGEVGINLLEFRQGKLTFSEFSKLNSPSRWKLMDAMRADLDRFSTTISAREGSDPKSSQ